MKELLKKVTPKFIINCYGRFLNNMKFQNLKTDEVFTKFTKAIIGLPLKVYQVKALKLIRLRILLMN